MHKSLAISLGHNSSAVFIIDGEIICGYEEERLSGIKADSHFPVNAIDQIQRYHDLEDVDQIFVSHWATYGDVDEMSPKHWDRVYLQMTCPKAEIIADLDHHDCHVYALRAFTKKPYKHELVVDGFGNFNETISVYHEGRLIHRVFGFEKSLGLLYQYATAYLGMTMNQDEYKLLGYEAHILEVVNNEGLNLLNKESSKFAEQMFTEIIDPSLEPKFDLVAGLEALPNIRLKYRSFFDRILVKVSEYMDEGMSKEVRKTIIAYFVQSVVEKVMISLITFYNIKEVALTGGVFMNVKVNNVIAECVDKIAVFPICGDQGAALGAYHKYHGDLRWPDHLFWGKRNLQDMPDTVDVYYHTDLMTALDAVEGFLNSDLIVNFVYGAMEFGARALGHTTTFALPTMSNVDYINHVNERSTVMPMAGMISSKFINLYHNYDKVYKSLEYMIMTLDSKEMPRSDMMGCHHKHPLLNIYTNRVQLIPEGHFLYSLLNRFAYGTLINTSFNRHGVPIVCTQEQILETHNFQIENDYKNRIVTVIVEE